MQAQQRRAASKCARSDEHQSALRSLVRRNALRSLKRRDALEWSTGMPVWLKGTSDTAFIACTITSIEKDSLKVTATQSGEVRTVK